MPEPRTATREESQAARAESLELEKEHTRRGDGRDEGDASQHWVRRHDEYGEPV